MAGKPAQVQVVGLRALMRDLARSADDQHGTLLPALVAAGRQAAEPVASTARSAMAAATTASPKGPHLLDDIRVTAARTGASVRMGRSAIRWAGWVEFGGNRRVPHLSTRPYDPRGRYLFPAAVQMAAEGARLYEAAVTKAYDQYRWTNTTTSAGSVHD